jgi:hypothetical protein
MPRASTSAAEATAPPIPLPRHSSSVAMFARPATPGEQSESVAAPTLSVPALQTK